MSANSAKRAVAALCICFLTGCRIHLGSNHLFFATRTNQGFDADTLPPVIELALHSRSEGVVAPTFEDAQNPPVVASFRRDSDVPSLGTTFVAGPAALALVDAGDQPETAYNQAAEIRLSQKPTFAGGANAALFRPGEAPPMWFGVTDSTALEFEFHGPGVFPALQSVHLGHRRKEFLITPLTISRTGRADKPFVVRTPSVIALVNATSGRDGAKRAVKVQFFAIGKPATELARQKEVRHLFIRDLAEGYWKSREVLAPVESRVKQMQPDEGRPPPEDG